MTATQPTLGLVSQWELVHYAHPWSLNEERQWHWTQRRATVAEWRKAFCMIARHAHVPRCARIAVTATPLAVGQDTANCFPALKAAVDGLVDAGVVPRDTAEYVVAVTFRAPRPAKRQGLEVVVRGEHMPHA